jgi:hypothetical protein
MRACCLKEAERSLERHRDVATCDECGSLLIAYGNDRDYENTIEELSRRGVAFETASLRNLKIVAKPRTRSRS